ncbi:MAG: type II methylase, partial [Planctomycetia bacterium]|nr:type II methylase [Planctomycetia bacterium]
MSQLIDFYRGQGRDSENRRIGDIWEWTDADLEDVHDYIQWLFPLPEPSRFNPHAPLLTKDDIAAFRSDELRRAAMRKSFDRILTFLGLTLAAGEVAESTNFSQRSPEVWDFPNHNWLRVTRILRSLTLAGLEPEAQALFAWLDQSYRRRRFP